MFSLGLVVAGALLGCKTSDEETRARAGQEIAERDEYNRERDRFRAEDLALVEKYQGWFERLRAIDHAGQGLPEPEVLPDGALRPATESEVFCDRVATLRAGEAVPSGAAWMAAYREQAARWLLAGTPQEYGAYRDRYLAERHLARLACIARDGGTELRRALLAPLDAPAVEMLADNGPDAVLEPGFEPELTVGMVDEVVQYTAAVYAMKHDMDPRRGERMLRLMSREGLHTFETYAYALVVLKQRPLALNPSQDAFYKMALQTLGPEYLGLHGRRKMRTGTLRQALP